MFNAEVMVVTQRVEQVATRRAIRTKLAVSLVAAASLSSSIALLVKGRFFPGLVVGPDVLPVFVVVATAITTMLMYLYFPTPEQPSHSSSPVTIRDAQLRRLAESVQGQSLHLERLAEGPKSS
jgi:hypothetical protein